MAKKLKTFSQGAAVKIAPRASGKVPTTLPADARFAAFGDLAALQSTSTKPATASAAAAAAQDGATQTTPAKAPTAGANARHPSPSKGADVRVGRQTAGRRGKGVTVITGIPLPPASLEALTTELKKRCGSGGTLKDGVIEIQGDHRDVLVEVLSSRFGWNVKRSGG